MQAWADNRLNLTEKIIEMRAQPLIYTLQALTEEEHHRRFRCLAEPLWMASTPLNLDVVHRRLREQVAGKPTLFYCPVQQCRKTYKLRAALNKHLYKHCEFVCLSPAQRDEVLQQMTFKLPPDCGLRCTILAAEECATESTTPAAGQKRPYE